MPGGHHPSPSLSDTLLDIPIKSEAHAYGESRRKKKNLSSISDEPTGGLIRAQNKNKCYQSN